MYIYWSAWYVLLTTKRLLKPNIRFPEAQEDHIKAYNEWQPQSLISIFIYDFAKDGGNT